MPRIKRKSGRNSGVKKQTLSSIPHQKSKETSASHGRKKRHPVPRPPASSVEESSRLDPVLVEPSSNIELTEIAPRWGQTIPSLRGDADYCTESTEGAKLSSPSYLESHCLKVTFNPEQHLRFRNDGTSDNQTSASPYPQLPSSAIPSKDDILSVVIQKLTELVNDSEKRQSQALSLRSTTSRVCSSTRRDGTCTGKKVESLHKCPKCPCLFTPTNEQLKSKEAALCQCCDKAHDGSKRGKGDRSSSEEKTVTGKQTDSCTTKDLANAKCELCSHVASGYEDLLYHLLSEHADARICKCKLCDFFTTVEARIVKHAAVHNAPHVYKCSCCPFVTEKLAHLQGHMKDHNKGRELLLKCSECGFSCRCEDTLRAHMWEHIPTIRSSNTARTPTPKPKEAMPDPAVGLDDGQPPSVPSPALPMHTRDREQPYIFKCLLCGYLCDRLATLKAHAWRHAGEQGCSYPVVDEDECLKQSLSNAPSTASKHLPLTILSSAKLGSLAETQKRSSSCCGESGAVPCGCCSGPRNPEEYSSNCHCDGINIPPSSVPLIKKLLIQKKLDHGGQANTGDCERKKPNQNTVSFAEADNQTSESSNNDQSNLPPISTHELQPKVVAVSDGYTSDAGNLVLGKQSRSNGSDPHLLVIDPVDPLMLFLDLDIPEPAAMVEATTELSPAGPRDQMEVNGNAFDPFTNRMAGEQPMTLEGPRAVSPAHEGVLSSQTHPASMSTSPSEESTERHLQSALKDPDTAQDCRQKVPQHAYLEGSELGNNKDLNLTSGSVSVVSCSSQPSYPLGLEQSDSQTNQGHQAIQDVEKMPVVEGKVDDTCCTDVLKSQGRLIETLIKTALSGESAQVTFQEDAGVQAKQEMDSPRHDLSTDGEGKSPQITNQSKLIQEKYINNNVDIANAFGGLKRGAIVTSTESSRGAKRVCFGDEKSTTETSTNSEQGITTQLAIDGQVIDRGKDSEKSETPDDMSSEEDSIVKFFMNRTANKAESFQCKLCSKTYETYTLLKQHLQIHLVHNTFRCPLCKECFESLDRLKHHIQKHYQELYRCSECSAFFDNKIDLEAHRQSHSASAAFKCEACEETFPGRVAFIRHQENVHSNHTSSHVRCTHCGEGFSNTNTLLLHILSCPMRKMRSCKECSYLSETPEGLQEHIRDRHLKVKLFKCTLCDYKSSAKNGIKNHMKFHVTDRPYKCDLCNFTGAYPQSLRSHMRMHTRPGWRPDCLPSELPEQYKCKLCCYTCNYLPSLKSHMWRHASDPNYSYKGKQSTGSHTPISSSSAGAVQSQVVGASKQRSPSPRSSPAAQGPGQTSEVVCNLVTFCCQECGFQSTDRSRLVEHLKTHILPEVLEAGRNHSKDSTNSQTKRTEAVHD